MTVGIVAHPIYSLHLTGKGHPEQPKRESVIREALHHAELLNNKTMIDPLENRINEIYLCHSKEYVALVKQEVEAGGKTISTGDAQISPESFKVAVAAVGGVLAGVDAILQNKFKRVFCVVRPPGHHASKEIGAGFCLFNNAAIAARYFQAKMKEMSKTERKDPKVLIVDWDVHHGDGTEAIFAEDPSVFYFSTHEEGNYPGTGPASFKGKGAGEGTTLNVPIRKGAKSRLRVLEAFEGPLVEAMKSFKPEFIIISCGFDGHKLDPLGHFNLETADYVTLTKGIVELAEEYCDGKVLSMLEGGYNLNALAEASVAHVQGLK